MSPRTPEQYEEIREEKRTLIMDVALQHFADTGFHATTISHIAKHAGISKGLLYNYFRSKEELLGEIINRSAVEIFNSFDIDHDGSLSEYEFEHFLRRAFDVLRKNRRFWRLVMGIMLQRGVYEKLIEGGFGSRISNGLTVKEFWSRMSLMIKDYLGRRSADNTAGNDPETEFMIFINSVKGFAITLLLSDKLNNDDDSFERTINTLIRRFK